MAKKSVAIDVEGSVYDVLGALAKAVAGIKAAVKMGGTAEVAGIVTVLVADLTPILAEVASLPSDVSHDVSGSLEAAACQLPALIAAIVG